MPYFSKSHLGGGLTLKAKDFPGIAKVFMATRSRNLVSVPKFHFNWNYK